MKKMKVVRLLKNEKRLSREEYRRFSKGDLIFGENACPEELNRWNIDDLEEAKRNLKSTDVHMKKMHLCLM